MVINTRENGNSIPSGIASEKGADISAKSIRLSSPITPEASTAPMSCVRKQLESQGLSEQATVLVMGSWRNSTKKQYEPTLRDGSSTTVKGKWIPFQLL